MAENSRISWTHNSWNPWVGCDKVAPPCAHCYIYLDLRKHGRDPWGHLYRTTPSTWRNPLGWNRKLEGTGLLKRIFTCSDSDWFHTKADGWRSEAWDIVRATPNLVYLILTKRPERILRSLPSDWGEGYPNVWLGTSVGCNMNLHNVDSLRRVPVHPKAVRFLSCEPLLEDIADGLSLDGIGWLIAGGESGTLTKAQREQGKQEEYLWDAKADWRKELTDAPGARRTMKPEWAQRLLDKARAAGVPYFFKQITAPRSEQGEDALGRIYHEFPAAYRGTWARTPREQEDLVQIAGAIR